ncbi:50S ribosomal protein L15e [Caldivirga sp.]|uniref:50S ribosomal protein L15e n=1 Tax=Caldivirga sp. TaxID=2080243 RepID=UPI003D13792D
MGTLRYIADIWKKPYEDPLRQVIKARLIKWRREPAIVRVEKPTRVDKARKYGYKAKQGVVVVRVRVRRGPFNRRRPNTGRRPKRMGVYGVALSTNLQVVAEQRAARRFSNLEVLGSYWVGEDAIYKWFEVVMVDPNHPAIRNDPDYARVVGREYREGRRIRRIRERQRKLLEKLRSQSGQGSGSSQ